MALIRGLNGLACGTTLHPNLPSAGGGDIGVCLCVGAHAHAGAHTSSQGLKNLWGSLSKTRTKPPVTAPQARLAHKCKQVGSPRYVWGAPVPAGTGECIYGVWAQATGGSANFSSHAMLPESQESREFRLPGGHPTWVEGTGAKEEKVSDGWGPGQGAGYGARGKGWRSRPAVKAPLGSKGAQWKKDHSSDGSGAQGRHPSPAQRRVDAGRVGLELLL